MAFNFFFTIRFRVILVLLMVTGGVLMAYLDQSTLEALSTSQLNNPASYEEKINLINDSYNKGDMIESIETLYDCEIVLYTDNNYRSRLNHFVFVNGLLVDFIPDGQTSLGRIHFNVDKGEFGDELLEKQKRGYSVCLIVLISAYSLIGLLGVSVYIFNKRRY